MAYVGEAPVEPTFLEKFQWPLILAGLSIFCLVFSVVLLFQSNQPKTPITFSSDATESAKLSKIVVDVAGAVVRPGVYDLPADARVKDALEAAGGLSAEADEELVGKTVNKAAALTDGMKLFIPKKIQGTISNEQGTQGHVQGTETSTALISINSASLSELDRLPGVGPVTAGKIVSGRPYNDFGELVTKKAVSQSVFEKIKDQISL